MRITMLKIVLKNEERLTPMLLKVF